MVPVSRRGKALPLRPSLLDDTGFARILTAFSIGFLRCAERGNSLTFSGNFILDGEWSCIDWNAQGPAPRKDPGPFGNSRQEPLCEYRAALDYTERVVVWA